MSCNNKCNECKSKCSSDKSSTFVLPNKFTNIKNMIAITSGKGGVGKSSVTCILANDLVKMGYKVGILDADITGPSIAKAYGISGGILGEDGLMLPKITDNGIKVMSANFLLKNESDPVALRGPLLAGALKQLYTDVKWGVLDYLLIDMPPGTGDIIMTLYQSFMLSGIIVVTTPSDLVEMVVKKSLNLALKFKIPVIGLVSNMAYFKCPCCNEKSYLFGESKLLDLANKLNIPPLCEMGIDPLYSDLYNKGEVDKYNNVYYTDLVTNVLKFFE